MKRQLVVFDENGTLTRTVRQARGLNVAPRTRPDETAIEVVDTPPVTLKPARAPQPPRLRRDSTVAERRKRLRKRLATDPEFVQRALAHLIDRGLLDRLSED